MDVIADSAENNTLLKRDTVFAQMNFGLKSGIFKIATPSPNVKGETLLCLYSFSNHKAGYYRPQ